MMLYIYISGGIGYGIDPLSALSDRPTDRREKPRVTFDDTCVLIIKYNLLENNMYGDLLY